MKKKDSNAAETAPEEIPQEATEQTPAAEAPQAAETPQAEEAAQAEGSAQAEEPAQQASEATPEQWRAALELAVKQRDEYLDSLRRSQADFQNFKRRNQTARSDGYEDGVREAVAAILPAIDNLERALDAAEKAGESGAVAEGVKMTLNALTEGLKRFGFEEIPALGEQFDPELHNAVMREPGDEPGKVLEVFQRGYRVKGKIIRYAMVKVCSE